MSLLSLNVSGLYPDGTSVKVYPEVITDSGHLVPAGEKITEGVVVEGVVNLDIPADGRMYTLAALLEGEWQVMRVTTSAPSDLSLEDVFSQLEDHIGLHTTAHGGIVASTDPRLTDARVPTPHHATHNTGGTDAIAPGDISAEAVANKDTDSTMAANSDVKYPSQKAVKTALATKPTAVLDTDSTMAANSDARVASQKATKTALALKEDAANKGNANGYASLEAAGKVPVAQLPSAIMEYQGTWNANTNTPALADGAGNKGDVYRVSVAAERNLGSGVIDFQVGDYAIYNGATWEKSDTTDSVASVAGKKGVVTLAQADIEGLVAALEGKQPLDADLTSIAALATAAFGRSLLTMASAAATREAIAAQPEDADLTAIAALATTAFGRSLLTQASAEAARATLEAQKSLGYTAENEANKDTDTTLAANSNTKYPSQKAIKAYVDGLPAGKGVLLCRAATTAALATNTLSGNKLTATANGALASQDGVALAVGDYLLVKNEGEGKKNGVYKVLSLGSAGSKYELERVSEMDTSEEARPGMLLRVAEGTQNGGVTFTLLTTGAITLNTTALTFGYASAWVAPTFLNSWENFGSGYLTAAYRKGLDGRIQLRGMVKKTSSPNNTVIFTLPAGFRPSESCTFACMSSNANPQRIDVAADGSVTFTNAAAAEWVSLSGISFYPD